MEIKIEQFTANNPNPVLSVTDVGTILYSNVAGEPLLHEWGVTIGEKLPPYFVDIVKGATSINSQQKIEVKAGNSIYLVSFHPLPEEKCVNIYGFDISEQKELEGKLREAYENRHMQSEELKVQKEELQTQSEEIRETHKALHNSEEKYRMLFTNMTEPFYLVDVIYDKNGKPYDYRFLEVNPAYELTMGIKTEQMLGRSLKKLFPNANPTVLEKYEEIAISGKSAHFEAFSHVAGEKYLDVYAFSPEKGKLAVIFRDVTECKQEELKIRRYNQIIEGNNKIFSNVVQAKTKEELANVCLSVALYLSGSLIGFIGLVGDDGQLHDIAISEMGWNQCQIYNKAGHRRPPENLPVHGLYGSVIDTGKGFFTNKPLSHLYSIGLPFGHPPINSFLGVPLILDGKTMGVIAVADRESGYSYEQQEDLEAIAPAVIQSLKRRMSEEALSEAYKNLQIHADELHVQSDELQAQTEELHKVNELLHESEKRYRTLAENSPDVIARIDRQKRYIYANPAAEEPYGWSLNEIIGKTHDELIIDSEEVKLWKRYHEDVLTTGKNKMMEFQHTSPQGKKYYFNTQIVPEFVDGEVTSVLAISRDITDILEAETRLKETLDSLEEKVKERTAELEGAYGSLKESENSLSEAQRLAHIGNWDWEIRTNKLHLSDEVYRIYGCEPPELNVSRNAFLSYIHPDDRDYVDKFFNKASNEKPINIDYRIVLANGEERIVQARDEVIFNEENIPVRTRGTIQDITKRKKAEEKIKRLANVVESSNDAIITQSLDGIITSWNKAAEQIYGYPAEEVMGKNISLLEPDNLTGEIKQLINKTKQEEKVLHYETLRRKKDGTTINASVTLSPVFDASGKFAAVSCIARDITNRKKAEETLKSKMEELSASNTELEQFAYVSSHDLQEPLRMISSYLQLLQRRYQGKLDEKADKYIYFAVDGASRMQVLINDLLELSRVTTKAEEPKSTDCGFILNQVLSDLELYIKENKATVSHNPLPEVMADNTQLAQVFQNLIANGIKFHGEETPKMALRFLLWVSFYNIIII